MTIVAGRSVVNRPFFFTQENGQRMEIPSFDSGQGDLDGGQLSEFEMYVSAGQIERTEASTAPFNTSAPTISGIAKVDEELTGDDGQWGGNPQPTITRKWLADGSPISGATGTTYIVTIDDVGRIISLEVTATNSVGSDVVTSNELGPVEE